MKYKVGLFGFKFRYNLDEEYRTCKLGPKPTPRQPKPEPKFEEPSLLYPNGRKLAGAKVVDMIELMKFVPEVYQDFYKAIIKSHEREIQKYKEQKRKKGRIARQKKKSQDSKKAKRRRRNETESDSSSESDENSDHTSTEDDEDEVEELC